MDGAPGAQRSAATATGTRLPVRHGARPRQRRRPRQERRGGAGADAADFSITEDDKPQTIRASISRSSTRAGAAARGRARRRVLPQKPMTASPASGASPTRLPPSDGRHARPPADRAVFRPELDAARGAAARRASRARLRRPEAVAGRSDRGRLVLDVAAGRRRTSRRTATLLDAAIDALRRRERAGIRAGTTGDAEGTPDTGTAFTPDDTEFNMFNTDRRLDALQRCRTRSRASSRRSR